MQNVRSGIENMLANSRDTPILHGLTEVEFIRDILSTNALGREPNQELTGFEARILKKHLRKVIIDYTLRFGDSTRGCIGLYRESDKRLGRTFSVLETLTSNGFGPEDKLRVPKPIAYIPALSFLMIERAEGRILREIFERSENPYPYVKGAAQWIAKLHNSEIKLDYTHSQDKEIETSLRYTRTASWLLPRLESEVHSLAAKLVRVQKALRTAPRKTIHGDYHPRNIIVSPEITTVIDFEEAGMGDPAFDVGYFIAQTKMTHGTQESTVRATDTFFEEYTKDQPNLRPDFAQRVAVFEAQTYFQRIYHTYYLLQLKPDLDRITEWLNECKTSLNKASDGEQ
ncbi:MAG TPA: aminoglycoside phosphotransferase family protein [Candidatus Dormibacteraeota bacterium]|jgi:aminoglycoside phosphotransferase (APT) family kinase protein|nr:aminoglycoside phosphotransferase family protein [Candidatus Dormibacteraeota bacterium]